ncbi:MAG: UvrD-helicase domain-containing protein [Mariprofundaceae bacterium]
MPPEPNTHALNEQQYRAVHHRGGPLLVLAGAGSGKTRVITERIAALLERDVPPDAITAVTFTNKAAREMRERLASRLGKQAKALRISTFHALGLAMLREHAERAGRRPNLTVFAGAEQKSAMRSVLKDMDLPADADAIDRMLAAVSRVKNALDADDAPDGTAQAVRERYDDLLVRMNAVDFDDLMALPVRLLQEHDDILALWRMRARHFLIDEYQDSSRIQYALVRLLAPPDGHLTAVGDDDQSIYGWRGAEVRNLFQLERDYPELTVIRLEENYRSTGHILRAANSLIAHNSERLGKELRSNLGPGKPVRVWECDDPADEARRIAGDIRALRAGLNAKWDDFCVLYRASFLSREVERALREAGIPYHVSGGISFFDRAEIQDTLAWMRLCANFADDLAFMRAIARPRRGIGAKALETLGDFAHLHGCSLLEACLHDELEHRLAPTLKSFGETVVAIEHMFLHVEADDAFDALLDFSGLEAAIRHDAADEDEAERRIGNVMELRRWWLAHAESGGDLASFMQQMFLLADKADDDPSGQVRLMTVHAAKGLEFGHVWLIGMEDGLFPHKNALEENRMEEERRLMYVAMTRARHRLTLSLARTRRRFGKTEKSAPSPFLKEIDPESLHWADRGGEDGASQAEVEDQMAAIRAMLEKAAAK